MAQTRSEVLQNMPIFGGLREDALRVLLEQAHSVERRAGAWFFREGDPARSMFVLETGQAQVTKHWGGREFVLNSLQPGDCFGEMALMDLAPRSASVRAESDCRSMEFSTDDLLRLYEVDVEQFALIQMNIGREVCRRLRITDDLLFRERMGAPRLGPDSLTTY